MFRINSLMYVRIPSCDRNLFYKHVAELFFPRFLTLLVFLCSNIGTTRYRIWRYSLIWIQMPLFTVTRKQANNFIYVYQLPFVRVTANPKSGSTIRICLFNQSMLRLSFSNSDFFFRKHLLYCDFPRFYFPQLPHFIRHEFEIYGTCLFLRKVCND